MIDPRVASTSRRLTRRAFAIAASVTCLGANACFRGKLPPREFYRLTSVMDSAVAQPRAGNPPLSGSIAIAAYDAPGIYGTGFIVYRNGAAAYGTYPSREWAIPLGDMLGAMTESAVRRGSLTSGRAVFHTSSVQREEYAWRGVIREFDEVDDPASVSAAVALSAQLVRVADDSVIWSGTVRETERVRESRSMPSVVEALSLAASRAVDRLATDAATALHRLTAAGAQRR
ncbi:MAG TPA: ABC-type transport auxiliary lipoprotein family protein [Gemmatimonadaceae bacterium]|nr:ABC-type transport auxiliary lipoprotein family protein [Gemmatimonadaceae bacterium]